MATARRSRSTRAITLDHLVCELDTIPGDGPYRWYELDLDRATPVEGLRQRAVAAGVIATTRASSPSRVLDLLGNIVGDAVTHLQFQLVDNLSAPAVLAECSKRHLDVIPSFHFDAAPTSAAHLQAVVERLSACGTDIIKVAYPSPSTRTLDWGLELLDGWSRPRPRLSLTPMGGAFGRVAAALAGSRLVYSPLQADEGRPSASWWLQLVTEDRP